MNKMNLTMIVAIAAAFAFSSCTVKVGEVEEPSNPIQTLDGTWATTCMEDSNDSDVKSFQLQEGTLTVATLRYTGTRYCEQDKHSSTVMFSGPLTVTGDSALIEKAKDYEREIQMVVGIPYDQQTVDDLNNSSACGSNSWAIGQAGVLLACNVPPGFDLSNVANGTKHYGSYYIQQNVEPPYMHFESKCSEAGYDFICPTANDRPTTTDGTVFIKQKFTSTYPLL